MDKLFHVDGGGLDLIGETNVGYGMVNLFRCNKCGKEIDSTDIESFAHFMDGELLNYKGQQITLLVDPADFKLLTPPE